MSISPYLCNQLLLIDWFCYKRICSSRYIRQLSQHSNLPLQYHCYCWQSRIWQTIIYISASTWRHIIVLWVPMAINKLTKCHRLSKQVSLPKFRQEIITHSPWESVPSACRTARRSAPVRGQQTEQRRTWLPFPSICQYSSSSSQACWAFGNTRVAQWTRGQLHLEGNRWSRRGGTNSHSRQGTSVAMYT